MVGAYIRVSTGRQGDGESPENQRERLKAAGADEFYVDVVSGFKKSQRRKAVDLLRLTADIAAGKLTRLLTTRLDRVARRDAIVMELSELCDGQGVEFLSLQSGKVDTTTTAGWLSVKMELLLAEHYSRQLSENVRNGLAAQIRRGIHTRPASSLPFHLAPDPDSRRGVVQGEAWEDARHAVEQVMAGTWTLSEAARFINERHGSMAATSSFSRWLRSPAILGHACRRDGTVQIAACWPPLVSESEHERLLEVVAAARKRWGANKTNRLPLKALSGLCLCACCGERMVISTCRVGKYTYEYLRCDSRRGCSVKGRNAPALIIEQLLLIEHVMPRMEAIISASACHMQHTATASPERAQWLRELRHRKRTPPEWLMPSERERINELERLIAADERSQSPVEAPDLAPLALRLTNVTLSAASSWFSDPPPIRNQHLKQLLASVTVAADQRRVICVSFRVGQP